MSDDTRKPTKSWSEKIKDARAQARALRQTELDAAIEGGNQEEIDRLMEAEDERINGRRRAKLEAAKLKREIKLAAPAVHRIRWADTDASRDWRSGKRAGKSKNSAAFNMTPGSMVRLVNDARVYTEGSWVMVKRVPKGTLGILIDAPPADLHGHVAVMFGADIFRIECKKLRMIHDDD